MSNDKFAKRLARLITKVEVDPKDGRNIYTFTTSNKYEYEAKLKDFEMNNYTVVSYRYSDYYGSFLIEYKRPYIPLEQQRKKYKESESLRDTIDFYDRRSR